MNSTAALRGWTEAGWRKVLLPSGVWLRVRLPSIDHLLRKNAFPHELEAIVLKYTMGSFRLSELTKDETIEFLRMRDTLIVHTVRERLVSGDPDDEKKDPPVWEPIDLAPHIDELGELLPGDDLDKLGLIAMRYQTPQAVTAQSRINLGLARLIRPDEEDGPSAGEFRGVDHVGGSAGDGTDGGEVREESGDRLSAAGKSGARASGRSGSPTAPSGS